MSGERCVCQYSPKWERLHDALNCLMRAGVTENDAKQSICNAIADRAIEIRLTLRERIPTGTTVRDKVLDGADVEIPAHLEPQQMDFEDSRPLKPWVVKRERIAYLAGYWHIEWIEVSSAEVTKILIPAVSGDRSSPANG